MTEPHRAVVEALPDPALLVDLRGTVFAASPSARSLLDLDRGHLDGTELAERAEDPDALGRFLRTAAASTRAVPGSLLLRDGAGEVVRLGCHGARVPRPAGSGSSGLVLLRLREEKPRSAEFVVLREKIDELNREIRRRREVEAELQRSRLFLEETQAVAELGSWDWDMGTGELTWSRQLYRVFGLDPDGPPIDYATYRNLIAPEDRERTERVVQEAAESGGSFAFDHAIVRPDGARRVLHGRGRVITDGAGRPVRMMGSAQDITERKRQEERRRFLADAGAELASGLDYEAALGRVARLAVPDLADCCAVDVLEGDRIRRLATVHVEEAVRWAAAEIARRWPPRIDDDHGAGAAVRSGEPQLFREIPPALLEEASRDDEHLARLKELDLRSAMVAPMVAGGEPVGAVTLACGAGRAYDADDLEFAVELGRRAAQAVANARAFEEANRAVRVRDEIASMVAHDLRNPLGAIGGAADLIVELSLSGEALEKQVGVIQRSVTLMDRLVRDLGDATVLDGGRISVDPGPQRLDEIVAATRETWKAKCEKKCLELDVRLPDRLPEVRADEQRLVQALDNLVGNAIKFTPSGGKVVVSVEVEADRVGVTVEDTGPGIKESERPRVFERFWRSSSSREEGLGLGLAITRAVVEAHGGRIEVGGEEGQGAVFYFTLPVDGPPEGEDARDPDAPGGP